MCCQRWAIQPGGSLCWQVPIGLDFRRVRPPPSGTSRPGQRKERRPRRPGSLLPPKAPIRYPNDRDTAVKYSRASLRAMDLDPLMVRFCPLRRLPSGVKFPPAAPLSQVRSLAKAARTAATRRASFTGSLIAGITCPQQSPGLATLARSSGQTEQPGPRAVLSAKPPGTVPRPLLRAHDWTSWR